MQQNPKCPYCGAEMILGYDGKGMAFGRCYFYCGCGAQAPCACVEYATPDDWIGIEGAAYLKATARAIQKPITLEEVDALEPDRAVYMEFNPAETDALVRMWGEEAKCFFQGYYNRHEYGKEFRCWLDRKPTEEERKAAEWEK